MPPVTVREETLGDQPVCWREAPGTGDPVLYVHGVPDSGALWTPLLESAGGLAPDLPGFGRSGKRGDGDFTPEGYADWIERFLDHVGAGRVRLVVHDWGGVGLVWAMRNPERVSRLVVIDAVPLLPGYRWHRLARAWRTPVAGEIAIGLTTRVVARRLMPRALADAAWEHFDQGTQRAILRLYRSAPPEELERLGRGLGTLSCPALVVWGERDPYIPVRFAGAYAEALGGEAEVLRLDGGGHWDWHERPDALRAISAFLGA